MMWEKNRNGTDMERERNVIRTKNARGMRKVAKVTQRRNPKGTRFEREKDAKEQERCGKGTGMERKWNVKGMLLEHSRNVKEAQ